MATLLFVHGTGVREKSYEESFARIAKEVAGHKLGLSVERCLWGDGCGAKLSADGASIPLYDATLSALPTQLTAVEQELALWAQLYQDPLYELRILASAPAVEPAAEPAAKPAFVPNKLNAGQILEGNVRALSYDSPEIAQTLGSLGINARAFDAARQQVLISGPFTDVKNGLAAASASQQTAVARAIVAQAIANVRETDVYPSDSLDAVARDQAVQQIAAKLGNASLSVGGWVARHLFGLAQRLGAMNYVQRKRGAITDAAYPGAGDILKYLARGDAIRGFIRGRIKEVTPPVLVLAHSLGGIACVDLLVDEAMPEVKLLVTAGSQAPFLYEINALPSRTNDKPLPDHLPPWLNIYDLRDFLSYVGGTIFPGRVQDVLIDSKQPFPESHGAYWTNPATWKAIGAHWRAVCAKEVK